MMPDRHAAWPVKIGCETAARHYRDRRGQVPGSTVRMHSPPPKPVVQTTPPRVSAAVEASFHEGENGRVCRFGFYTNNVLVKQIDYPADTMTVGEFDRLCAMHAGWCN